MSGPLTGFLVAVAAAVYFAALHDLEAARSAWIRLEIALCHFPPGTSKWNKIEHRLFSAISQNWRGKPLVSHEVIVKLIAATTTRTGLRVRSELDLNAYPAGVSVSDAEMETLYLRPDAFHGEWNYSLLPRLMLPQA